MKRNDGFTLVELIVVLVILAVLAAMIIPSLSGYVDLADKRVCEVNARTILRNYQYVKALEYDSGETVTIQKVLNGDYAVCADDIAGLTCPSGGVYTALANNAGIHCSIHGDILLKDISGDPGDPGSTYPGSSVLGSVKVGNWQGLLTSILESGNWGVNVAQGRVYTDGTSTYLFTWPSASVCAEQAAGEISLSDYAATSGEDLTQILDSAQTLTEDDIDGTTWKNGGASFVVSRGAVLTLDSGTYVWASSSWNTGIPTNPVGCDNWIKLIDTE